MEHGVGGAAQGHDHGDGIFEGLARQDVQRLDVLFKQVADGRAHLARFGELAFALRGIGGAVGQAHAQRLDGRGHGVGGVHAAACARARTRVLEHRLQFALVDVVGQVLAVGFEGRDDVQLAPVEVAGLDGAAVDHNAGSVDAGHGHEHARHVLVATRQRNVGVVILGTHDRLDGIGDDVARDQRRLHALGAHADAVADADGMEDETDQVRLLHALLDPARQRVEVHVAGVALPAHAGDAHLRLLHVIVIQAHAVEHGLGAHL